MAAEVPTAAPKKKRRLQAKAFIEEEFCSGCEACVDICPVDCIDMVPRLNPSPWHAYDKVCVIDTDRCTGCRLCWEICPWDCIVMVERDELAAALDEAYAAS